MKKLNIARYGRGQKTLKATCITSNPRSGKLGVLNKDDGEDDGDGVEVVVVEKLEELEWEVL